MFRDDIFDRIGHHARYITITKQSDIQEPPDLLNNHGPHPKLHPNSPFYNRGRLNIQAAANNVGLSS
jgi:hypothetical protein